MKARLKSAPLWLRVALVAYVVVLGWLVIARVSGNKQQIVLKEPLELIDRPTLGRADAPVSIVIFSDFQCSYCRDFDREVLPRLEREFVETGKAKITFLHYPFMNENSYRAALAAECVYQQNPQAFWAYKSAVFALQRPFDGWETGKTIMQEAKVIDLNINAVALRICIDTEQSKTQIDKDKTLAKRLMINSVPTIFVNEISVLPTFSKIKFVLDEHRF